MGNIKEQYLQERNSNTLNLNTLYQYFNDKSDLNLDFNQFQKAMQNWINFGGNQRAQTIQETLDFDFGLNILRDKNGNFLKAYLPTINKPLKE